MTNPKTTANTNGPVVAEEAVTSRKTAQIPDAERSISDERRFRDVLEDDEVREVLRVRHAHAR